MLKVYIFFDEKFIILFVFVKFGVVVCEFFEEFEIVEYVFVNIVFKDLFSVIVGVK